MSLRDTQHNRVRSIVQTLTVIGSSNVTSKPLHISDALQSQSFIFAKTANITNVEVVLEISYDGLIYHPIETFSEYFYTLPSTIGTATNVLTLYPAYPASKIRLNVYKSSAGNITMDVILSCKF